MRVIVISDFANAAGGAERIAIETAVALADRGVPVTFLAAVGPVDDVLVRTDIDLRLLGSKPIKEKSKLNLLADGLWSRDAYSFVSEALAEVKGDAVVHLHAWQRAFTASALKAVYERGLPLVLTAHEYGFACPNQGFFDYQKFEICKKRALGWGCLTTHCDTRTYAHKLWRTARIFLQHQVANLGSAVTDVIYLSDLSRSVLEPYFQTTVRWHAVRNPMRLEKSPKATPEKNDTFLFVGRLSLEKGVDVFAKAAHEARVKAVIVGDGPQSQDLKSQFPNLTYRGWLDERGVAEALGSARALVFPSRWYEGQPLVVQEALSKGLPVIVSDATAAREAVPDEVSGLHFQNMNVASLTRALTRIAENDGLVTRLGASAYDRYWQKPQTLATYGKELEDLMLSVVRRRGAPSADMSGLVGQ